ncbi:MAG TPA: hypothetical protein VIV40_09820 [Kofleriaceae bacterium]
MDLPRPRVELELGRRRHRRITGPAGLLLFVCLFLPAVKGCNETVYPMSMPMFWHPYIYGLVLALATASVTVRHLHYTVLALRILAWLTVVGSAVFVVFAGGVALVELIVGALLLAAIGSRGVSERRVAVTTIAIGALSLLWFGLWVATPDAMVGVYLSAAASVGLLAGGLVWLVETS